jgi:hypothetical protein
VSSRPKGDAAGKKNGRSEGSGREEVFRFDQADLPLGRDAIPNCALLTVINMPPTDSARSRSRTEKKYTDFFPEINRFPLRGLK